MIDFSLEIRLPAMLERPLARLAFTGTLRLRTWKKIAAQIRHGVSLTDSLQVMHKRAVSRKSLHARVFEDVLAMLDTGHGLDTALAGYASPEEVMLIGGGQESGNLAGGLALAAELILARQKIVGAVVGALVYPAMLMGIVLLLLVGVSTLVVPQLASMSEPTTWTGSAAALYAVSSFVASLWGVATLCGLGLGTAAVIVSLPYWTGSIRRRFDQFPPWSLYRLTVGAVWLYTLATLMRSGKEISQILTSMLDMETLTPWLRERVAAVQEEFEQGKDLGEALHDTGMNWPDAEIVDDLRVYATLPGFFDRLQELADDWLDEGIELVQRQARTLNVVCMLVIILTASGLALSIGGFYQQAMDAMGGM